MYFPPTLHKQLVNNMYHHTVSNLSSIKSTFNYGYGFRSHVEAYWVEKMIDVYYNNDGCDSEWVAYHNIFKCYGYGKTEAEAVEELLIALDDGRR